MMTIHPHVDPEPLVWEAPGKGDWRGLHDHFPRALTPEYQLLLDDGMRVGEADWIARYGLPVTSMAPAFVHGRVFISAVPLVGKPSNRLPPAAAVKLAVKVVPAFRRAAAAAERAVAERPWRAEAEHWFGTERDEWVARNAALDEVDPHALDDAALLAHLAAARTNARDGYRTHFRLHGCDLIPTGRYLARSQELGLDPLDAAGLLAGWSPASRGEDEPPAWSSVTGYDLDERCAAELPSRSRSTLRTPPARDEGAERRLRDRVPVADRDEWDELLDDARVTYGVRDSNGLVTGAWPIGLLRRAMLEVGRRLVDRGALTEPDHAVELTVAELTDALRSPAGDLDLADVAAARLAERRRLSETLAPGSLGPALDIPLAALPPAMRALAGALLAVRDLATTTIVDRSALHGVGIGTGTAEGRACVAADPAEALARFEPGDIIVTAGTCPAWNSVLALAGGVVTEEGGPLSHAAIIAREIDLPAIVGCPDAVATIADGATIRLDLDSGRVHIT